MKYDAERIAHCEKMLRLYCHNADGTVAVTTVHVIQYKYTNTSHHVKVVVANGLGQITDITRHVGVLGGHRFLKNESLISIGQTTDPAYTVAKVLGVKDIRTEVL